VWCGGWIAPVYSETNNTNPYAATTFITSSGLEPVQKTDNHRITSHKLYQYYTTREKELSSVLLIFSRFFHFFLKKHDTFVYLSSSFAPCLPITVSRSSVRDRLSIACHRARASVEGGPSAAATDYTHLFAMSHPINMF
jgi:hypothetical protein